MTHIEVDDSGWVTAEAEEKDSLLSEGLERRRQLKCVLVSKAFQDVNCSDRKIGNYGPRPRMKKNRCIKRNGFGMLSTPQILRLYLFNCCQVK